MQKIILVVLIIFLSQARSIAQIGLGMYSTEYGLQNFRLNPALADFDKHFFLGISHVNLDLYNSAGNLRSSLAKDRNGDPVLDLDKLISTLDPLNNTIINNEWMSFYLGFKLLGFRLGLYHSFRSQVEVEYPQEAIQLLYYGNAPYVGQRLSIGPKVNYVNYNQVGVHLAYKLKKLSFGVNINKLFGTAYAQTNSNKIEFYTDTAFYQIEVKTDYDLLSASSLLYEDPYTIRVEGDKWTDVNLDSNSGWSLDLGANLEVNERLSVHGFIRDMGFINFDENVNKISSNSEFNYEGGIFDVGILQGQNDFKIDLDSVFTDLGFESKKAEAFKYELSSTWGLGFYYNYSDKLDIYGSGGSQKSFDKSSNNSYFQIGLNRQFLKFLRLNLNYSNKYGNSGFGAGLSINPGPFDLFFYADDILTLKKSTNGSQTAIMAGLSLQF